MLPFISNSWIFEFIYIVIVLILLLHLWYQYRFSYWIRKNVQGPVPEFPFGNVGKVISRETQFFQPYCDSYFNYKHLPYVGMYCFHQPVLCINDLNIAKQILIKDFDYFQSHGIFSESKDPLAGHLFNLHGERWKHLRFKMSPAFSPGKLKNMYPLVLNVANNALEYLNTLNEKKESVNFSELYDIYTMEIVASVGFGVEFNGFKNKNTEFFVMGHEYFDPKSKYRSIVRALAFFAPDIVKILKIKRFSPKLINFFYSLVSDTVEFRSKSKTIRNDFLQKMIELKNEANDPSTDINQDIQRPFTIDDVAANTMLYLLAGYETSATVGQFAAYELAINPHVQEKARKEVKEVLSRHNNEFTYEAQAEMTYINMVLDETMRKYPPLRSLFRRCNKEYKLPDHDLVIDADTLVFIPIHSIQMDPKVFADPNKFDPERFSPENKSKLHSTQWMPFGEGPRKCLGLRQGYIQVKVALARILNLYELILDERTSVPIKIKTSAMSFTPEDGIWIKLKSISKDIN